MFAWRLENLFRRGPFSHGIRPRYFVSHKNPRDSARDDMHRIVIDHLMFKDKYVCGWCDEDKMRAFLHRNDETKYKQALRVLSDNKFRVIMFEVPEGEYEILADRQIVFNREVAVEKAVFSPVNFFSGVVTS